MKVYELSKKFNLSDKDLIQVLKTLEVQGKKEIDSFTSLTLIEVKSVENYFAKDKKEKKKEPKKKAPPVKKVQEEDKAGFLIVKKGKEEARQNQIAEAAKKAKEAEQTKPIEEKKVVKIPKKVLVKRKVKEAPPKENQEKISQTQTQTNKKQHKENVAEPGSKVFIDKKPPTSRGSDSRGRNTNVINKNDRGSAQGAKAGSPPKREFTSKDKKKDDSHWKRKDKRTGKDLYRDREQGRERILEKKKQKSQESKISTIPKSIEIMETVIVSELAKKLNIKASAVIAKLISMGVMVTINQAIDSDTALLVAEEYGCGVKIVSLYDETVIEDVKDEAKDLIQRPPIVTVMGHVDHGKTKLLDAIREADVVSGEAGGITQHIGAYQIKVNNGTIVFLDTPGHEAFTAMRARGAKVTDLVILVVAADDGVMPQTIEAINHAKEAAVPIVVAINKIDSPKANAERVKQQLADLDLVPEEWGGKTIMVEVSALQKTNLKKLLENILLEAELLELTANPNRIAIGTIIESKIDIGRGPVATILIRNGTLKIGNPFISGVYSGKVRALFNDKGVSIQEALPSTPVEVIGLDGVPDAGDPFNVVEDEKKGKQVAQKRQELQRVKKAKNVKKVTLDDLSRQIQEGEIQDLKIILKGDVQGSIEALNDSFHKLSNSEVNVKVIHSSTGAINESDVNLASASNAIIIGFHVHPNIKANQLAQREHVEIRRYSIIYDAINSVRSAMEGMLAPDLIEEVTGEAEVRELFKVPKIGTIGGCYVTNGRIAKNCRVRVIRDGTEIHEGELVSLKRFKEDVGEVKESFECGIAVGNFQDIKVGDVIRGYLIKEVAKTLA